jgi:hypothetical protein
VRAHVFSLPTQSSQDTCIKIECIFKCGELETLATPHGNTSPLLGAGLLLLECWGAGCLQLGALRFVVLAQEKMVDTPNAFPLAGF